MKLFNYILILIFVLQGLITYSQWNIQTGYDFGFIRRNSENWNNVQRVNFTTETTLKSNFVFSFNYGIDSYFSNMDGRISTNYTNTYSIEISKHEAIIKVNRMDLSFGYNLQLKNNHYLIGKITSGINKLSDIRIIESKTYSKKYLSSDNSLIEQKEFFSDIDSFTEYSERYGFPNKFISAVTPFTLSLDYRYKINKWFLNLHFSYTPFQREFIRSYASRGNQYFLLGLRLGYTLPQKSNNNAK